MVFKVSCEKVWTGTVFLEWFCVNVRLTGICSMSDLLSGLSLDQASDSPRSLIKQMADHT